MIEGGDFSSSIFVTQEKVTTYPKIGGGGTQSLIFKVLLKEYEWHKLELSNSTLSKIAANQSWPVV